MTHRLSLIEVAGVCHQDPLGLKRLHRWLTHLTLQPAFVAVEWQSAYFYNVIAQRPKFRKLVENEWSFLSPQDHQTLESSLGFEGDAHCSVFGTCPTIWLDKDRRWGSNVEEEAHDYAQDRLTALQSCAELIPHQADRFLCDLSRKVWADAKAERNPNGDCRDKRFADLIISRRNNQISNRAVVIVGASHARLEVPDSFVSRVQALESNAEFRF